jgi:hypothetical protein
LRSFSSLHCSYNELLDPYGWLKGKEDPRKILVFSDVFIVIFRNAALFHSLTHISYQKFWRLTAHVIILDGVILFKVVVTRQLDVTWNVQFVLVSCTSGCASTRQSSHAKVAMLS